MTTSTITSLAPLLARLFDEADAASGATLAAVADLSEADRTRMLRSRSAYRELYGRLKHAPLAVSLLATAPFQGLCRCIDCLAGFLPS